MATKFLELRSIRVVDEEGYPTAYFEDEWAEIIGAMGGEGGTSLKTVLSLAPPVTAQRVSRNAKRIEALELASTKNVNSLHDLPVAVSDVITLKGNKYRFGPGVNLGNARLVFSNGSEIQGLNSGLSSITSTTTGPLITCLDQTCLVSQIRLINPNGPLFSFRGSNVFVIILRNIVSDSYASLGTLDNVHAGLITLVGFTATSPGFTFTGTGNVSAVLFRDALFANYTTAAINMGTAVFDSFQVIACNFSSPTVSSAALDGATNSANITTRAFITGCVFNGSGDALGSNLTLKDLKFKYFGNFKLANSTATMFMSVDNSSQVTTISTSGVAVKVNMGTGASATINSRFTLNSNGTVTYTGLEDITVRVTYNTFGDVVSGNNKRFAFYVAKGGTIIPPSKSSADYDNPNPQNAGNIQAIVDLSTGNVIDLYVANTTVVADTTNINVIDISCIIDQGL